MARYIDADKAMEEINRIGGHNLCEWGTLGVKALIDRQPTADAVPKSEVEELNRECESLGKTVNEASELIRKLKGKVEEAKSGVAREIFEEIEKTFIDSSVLPDCVRLVDIDKIAELKKKYTGGERQ